MATLGSGGWRQADSLKVWSRIAFLGDKEWTEQDRRWTVSGVVPKGRSDRMIRIILRHNTLRLVRSVRLLLRLVLGCWWLIVALTGPPTERA